MARKSSGTMRTRLVPLLFGFMSQAGHDPRPIAARAGLSSEEISAPTLRLPVAMVVKIAAEVAEALGDPHLGLTMATTAQRGLYGVVEFAARNSPTVLEAMHRIVRYQNLLEDLARLTWEERHGGIVLEHVVPSAREATGPQGNEFVLALFLRILDELLEEPVVPRRIWFAHETKPRSLERLRQHFRTSQIDFGFGSNGILVPAEIARRPIRNADPALLSVLDEYARVLMPAVPSGADPLALVRARLRRDLASGRPSLEGLAKAMHMSARTLQRRLEEGGTSFSKLVDDVRSDTARQLVAQSDLSVTEISFMVGYAHPRAFIRAFARWTGETPQRYRARVAGAAILSRTMT